MRPARPVAYRASLMRRFDRFGARIAEERLHAAANRHDRRELLGEPHLHVVVEIRARHVQEPAGLLRDGLDDVGVGVAGGVDRDARRAVEEHVAVHVLDHRPGAALDDQRVAARVRRRDDRAIALDNRPGARTGQRSLDFWRVFHDRSDPEGPASSCLCPSLCLLSLPARAAGAVFEKHTPFHQPVTNPVGFAEVAAAAARRAVLR